MVISFGEFDFGFSESVKEEVDIEQSEVIQELVIVPKIRHNVLGSRNLGIGQKDQEILNTCLFEITNLCGFKPIIVFR